MMKFRKISLQDTVKRILRVLPEINPEYVKTSLARSDRQFYTVPEINELINNFERELYDSKSE